jgi:hypothetical protein
MMRNILKLPFFQLFTRKKKTNGAFWASIVGLGLSAAVLGVTKGRKKMPSLSIQNMMSGLNPRGNNDNQNIMSGFNPKSNIGNMDTAALTEFSEELLNDALQNNDSH